MERIDEIKAEQKRLREEKAKIREQVKATRVENKKFNNFVKSLKLEIKGIKEDNLLSAEQKITKIKEFIAEE